MVRLPARLTSRLARTRIAQIFNSAPPGPLIHCVDPAEILHSGAAAPVSREKMRALMENSAPVIWIGGSEPLAHAGVGHFVRAIAQSGHCVFLETGGTLLRQRIHEFQPLRELFLAVRLHSLETPEACLAVEGLRTARLSGFFTAIHSPIQEDSDAANLTTLRSFVAGKDVDGWLMTAASAEEAVVRRCAESRGLIGSSFWRQFSEHLEEALLAQTSTRAMHNPQAFGLEEVETEAGEEGVRIA